METKKPFRKKNSFKNVLMGLTLLICLFSVQQLAAQTTATKKSNGVFQIISFSNDSVKFKVVAKTKLYSVELVAGEQTLEAAMFSNSVDTVKWANGARFWPGSSMQMPVKFGIPAMTLPKGAVLTVSGFKAPGDFKATKIGFITEEGKAKMYYDIPKSVWEK